MCASGMAKYYSVPATDDCTGITTPTSSLDQ